MSYAAHIPHIGTIETADGVGSAHSRLCGSRISVSLTMKEGRVSEFAQQVKACLVGQASAAMIAHNIVGSTREEVARVREEVRAMLEDEGPPPTGDWAAYALLEPVRNYKSRYSTVLIAFDATLAAIDMALANAGKLEKGENV